MRTRAITGFFFVIVMLASVLFGHYVFGAFYLALSLFTLFEFYRLIKQNVASPATTLGLINGALVYIAFALITYADGFALPMLNGLGTGLKLLLLLPLTAAAIFLYELFRKSKTPPANIAYTFLGIVFVILPFTFFHALAYVTGAFNFHYPLAFLFMLWANDTGAYLVGSKFGRNKLFERHSPKKTWEGFVGGIFITAGTALIISHYYHDLQWAQWVTTGLIISIFGTGGDLVESMFKRSINVKDSGGILPGHGGLLDRFDGLLVAAPIVYTYLYFVVNA